MTTKIGASPPSVATASPEPEGRVPPQMVLGSAASVEAFEDVHSAYGEGWVPDMPRIEGELARLSGFDLLHTLSLLEHSGKLEEVLNAMSPTERQSLVSRCVSGGLLARESVDQPLVARFALPASMQKMVDELNGLQAGEKPGGPTTYNWSGYHEHPLDRLDRRQLSGIADMKPGDTRTRSGRLGGYGQALAAGVSGELSVARDADGSFRVGIEGGAELGAHSHFGGQGRLTGRGEADLGAAARVEYRFASAEEAQAAFGAFTKSAPEAFERYGRPTIIEAREQVALQALGFIGAESVKALKNVAGAEASYRARVDVSGGLPLITVKVEGKLERQASAALGVGGLEAEWLGPPSVESARKFEVEVQIGITDPKALADPLQYLMEHGDELAPRAEVSVTLSQEQGAGHHATVEELTFRRRGLELSTDDVEVAHTRKTVGHERNGLAARLDLKGEVGVDVALGYEKRHVEREEVLHRGKLRDLR